MFVNDSVAPLRGASLGLYFSQQYQLVQDSQAAQKWKARTEGYFYTVYDFSDEYRREIFSYQWHPKKSLTFPHVHFKKGEPLITRTHLPTGRISIESIAEFLIVELKVKPCGNWSDTIKRNREKFEKHRSWA
jgi:hypothetical protein